MQKTTEHKRVDRQSSAGGIPSCLWIGFPLARADILAGNALIPVRAEARAGPNVIDTGPPKCGTIYWRDWNVHWTGPPGRKKPKGIGPPKGQTRYQGRSPDTFARNRIFWDQRCQVRPLNTAKPRDRWAKKIPRGWSPPGRNGPSWKVLPGQLDLCTCTTNKQCPGKVKTSVIGLCDEKKFPGVDTPELLLFLRSPVGWKDCSPSRRFHDTIQQHNATRTTR